jgi:hypothetical protein
MVSQGGLGNRTGAVRRQLGKEFASYVARHPNLRRDFILIARQDATGDLVVTTVADIRRGGPKRKVSDARPRRSRNAGDVTTA